MTYTVFGSLLRCLVLFGLFLTNNASAITYNSANGTYPTIATACASNNGDQGGYTATFNGTYHASSTPQTGGCLGVASNPSLYPLYPTTGSVVVMGYYVYNCPSSRTGIYFPYVSPAPADRCIDHCSQSVSTPSTSSGVSSSFLEWQFNGDYCATNSTPPNCISPAVLDATGSLCVTPTVTCTLPALLNSLQTSCVTATCTFPLSLSQTTGMCVLVPDTSCTAPATLVGGICTVTLGGLTCPAATMVNGACPVDGPYTTGTSSGTGGGTGTGTGTGTIDYSKMPGSVSNPSNVAIKGGFGVSPANCNNGAPDTTCDADAILCALVKFTYESRCNTASMRADDTMATVQTGSTAVSQGTNALGTDSRIGVTDTSLAQLDKTNPFSSQCPADIHVADYKGASIDIPLSKHCGIFQMMGNVMLIIAGLISVSIIMKGL